jgi:hypothetical protein
MGAIKDSMKIIEMSEQQIDALKATIDKLGLSDEDKAAITYGLNLIIWLPKLILEQRISLHRLQLMLFGKAAPTKKPKDGNNNKTGNNKKPEDDQVSTDKEESANDEDLNITPPMATDDEPQTSGRTGRKPHTEYKAIDHYIPHEELKSGDLCPEKCGGKVYNFEPQTIIRINGQMDACANRYIIETKRCNLCGELFKPELPEHIGEDKYDAKFKAQLAVQKYFMGTPSYRQAFFQSSINIPVPHTTQWYLNEDVAGCAIPIFNFLCQLAANNNLLHIDDTHLKIIEEILDNKNKPDKKRRGMFTTGILAKFNTHKIILYFNGTDHAGENLDALLKHRTEDEPVIIMSDALSRNIPCYKNIISCFCLSHGYRKFEEIKSFYTMPCEKVVNMISEVYKVDYQTADMTDHERLEHHQKHSQPIMDKLYEYLHYLLDEKLVEPNDDLGKAINYMINHRHELTQFLRVAGVPLDNNALEQCLKIPIRHRKNSMFYKTKYGASVGGVLTSVIYTCILSDINPIEYLTMLQENREQIIKEPSAYLPWTYQDTLSESIAA